MAIVPIDERRILIPEGIYLGLEDWAAEERHKTDNDLIKALITPKSLAQRILALAVERRNERAEASGLK